MKISEFFIRKFLGFGGKILNIFEKVCFRIESSCMRTLKTNQIVRMRRIIRIFSGLKCQQVHFLTLHLIFVVQPSFSKELHTGSVFREDVHLYKKGVWFLRMLRF